MVLLEDLLRGYELVYYSLPSIHEAVHVCDSALVYRIAFTNHPEWTGDDPLFHEALDLSLHFVFVELEVRDVSHVWKDESREHKVVILMQDVG